MIHKQINRVLDYKMLDRSYYIPTSSKINQREREGERENELMPIYEDYITDNNVRKAACVVCMMIQM